VTVSGKLVPGADQAPDIAVVNGAAGGPMQRFPGAAPAAPASARVRRRLAKILSLDDFGIAARRHLPRPLYGYIAGAAETNQTLDDNRAVFGELGFVPKVLNNVSRRTATVELFEQTYRAPFGIAPMGLGALLGYRADIALAGAAAAFGIPAVVSGSSLIRLEDTARDGGATWFQAYLPGESQKILALIDRVERASYKVLVITVDVPVGGNRENNVRAGFSTPLKPGLGLAWQGLTHPSWLLETGLRTLLRHGMPHFENSYATRGAPILSRNVERDFGARDHFDWSHLDLIRRRWKGKLVVKGILDAGDAAAACAAGADGIIVSNHGGRQLDGAVSPMRVLPGIVAAAGPVPVMMDGGVRRGSDVLKAIALGARLVFVGRPFMFAAAIAGPAGVEHGIGVMAQEIDRDMALLGVNTLAEVTLALVMPRHFC